MVEKQTNVEQCKSLNQLIVTATHILTNLRTLCKVSDLKHKFGKMQHLYAYESFLLSLISGSQKKAKTFDFMAMFQEARQTAIDRTQTSRGKD